MTEADAEEASGREMPKVRVFRSFLVVLFAFSAFFFFGDTVKDLISWLKLVELDFFIKKT